MKRRPNKSSEEGALEQKRIKTIILLKKPGGSVQAEKSIAT